MRPEAVVSGGNVWQALQRNEVSFVSSDGLEDLSQACRRMQSVLIRTTQDAEKIPVPEDNLSGAVKKIELQLGAFNDFIASLNQLPDPSTRRSPNTGDLLIPFSVQALTAKAPGSGPERLLLDAYERTHSDRSSGKIQINYAPLFGVLPKFLTIEATNNNLPPPEKYIEHSLDESLRQQCAGFLRQRDAAHGELAELMKTVNARRKQPEFEDPLAGPIAKAEGQILDCTGRIQNLFDQKLKDVSPERVPECIAGVGVKVAPSGAVISNILTLHSELEKLLIGIGCARQGDPILKLSLPALGSSGNTISAEIEVSSEFLKSAGSDPVLLADLVQAYSESRKTLFSVYHALKNFPSLKGFQSSLEYALQAPLQSYEGDGAKTFNRLFSHDDIGLTQALFSLLGQTYLKNDGGKTEGQLIESTASAAPLLWVMRNYLRGDTESQIQAHELLENAPVLFKAVLPFLTKIRECIDTNDFVSITQSITSRIETTAGSNDLFESLSPIFVLSVLAQDRTIAQKLKNQIPNTDPLLQKVDSLPEMTPSFLSEVRSITTQAIGRLSATLSDYYREQEMSEFWDFFDRYNAYREDPSCIQGLAGNEAMSGGVLLKGAPGVGKSYLVECVGREYGLKCFSTSPDEDITGSGDDLLFNTAKKAFDEAIQHVKTEKTPCILFIDEAETMVPDRKNPATSLTESSLTGYILREVNEIRRKYPEIILIIASNYPEDLDPALLRIGRIDIQVEMKAPGESLREHIIQDTLEKSPVKIPLTDEQMADLVSVTEGFIPLQLVQCINELTRLDPIVARKREQPFTVNFESLHAKFKREAERRSSYKTEIDLRKEQAATDMKRTNSTT